MYSFILGLIAHLQVVLFNWLRKKNTTNIERLYNKIVIYVSIISNDMARHGEKFDGLQFYNDVNNKIGHMHGVKVGSWIAPYWVVYILFRLFESLEYKDGNLNENYLLFHFWNQMVRIPLKREPIISRVLQLALNSGQLIGRGGICIFPSITNYMLIENDIDAETYNKLNDLLNIKNN